MSTQEIRLECLRLACARVAPGAPIADLFSEAKRLLMFVDGFDLPTKIDGKEVYGKIV